MLSIDLRHFHWEWVTYLCQLCVTKILNCDWSVFGLLMRRMSLTRTHHATVVGPIRCSNRSNNCRVCKINERRSSLVRTHHAIFVFSSSLRPTKDESRMVCAGLNWPKWCLGLMSAGKAWFPCQRVSRACPNSCHCHLSSWQSPVRQAWSSWWKCNLSVCKTLINDLTKLA